MSSAAPAALLTTPAVPPEITFMIASWCDAKSLAKLSMTCHEYRYLADERDFWQELIHRDFHIPFKTNREYLEKALVISNVYRCVAPQNYAHLYGMYHGLPHLHIKCLLVCNSHKAIRRESNEFIAIMTNFLEYPEFIVTMFDKIINALHNKCYFRELKTCYVDAFVETAITPQNESYQWKYSKQLSDILDVVMRATVSKYPHVLVTHDILTSSLAKIHLHKFFMNNYPSS